MVNTQIRRGFLFSGLLANVCFWLFTEVWGQTVGSSLKLQAGQQYGDYHYRRYRLSGGISTHTEEEISLIL